MGIPLESFTPEARMVLRLGAKYARAGLLKKSLQGLLDSTAFQYDGRFRELHCAAEYRGFLTWKSNVQREIDKLPDPKWSRRELLISKGIRDLRNMDIVLKLSDKNLGIVPIEKTLYLKMARAHIDDISTYGKVPYFPRTIITNRIRTIVSTAPRYEKNLQAWLKFARPDIGPAPFYILPKLHKKKKNTSRPVTVQHSYILSPLSQALAEVLQEVVETLPTIAKDTKSIAQTLTDFKFERDTGIFLTYDVVALYPSIDLHDAVKVLETNIPKLNENNKFWLNILKLIMFHNYVLFEGEIYRQLRGTATGTAVAPQFANLYMHFKYQQVLDDPSIQLQRRFIDDGFLIVNTRQDAERIMQEMKQAGSLEFTHEVSETEAIFLDLIIFKGSRHRRHNRLDLRPFFKPTNRFLYLPALSNHPWHMKLGIAKGEAIRCLRNSTDKGDWLQAMHTIFKALIARGYQGQDLQRQWKKIRWEDRAHYLWSASNTKRKPRGTLVFSTFHVHTKQHWNALMLRHNLLERLRMRAQAYNEMQREIISEWPPRVIFKDFPKLARQLISAREAIDPKAENGKRYRAY